MVFFFAKPYRKSSSGPVLPFTLQGRQTVRKAFRDNRVMKNPCPHSRGEYQQRHHNAPEALRRSRSRESFVRLIADFQEVLLSNQRSLAIIIEMGETLGDYPFDIQFIPR